MHFDPSDIAFIKGVIAFFLVAGTGFAAWSTWLHYRTRGLPPADLEPTIQALRDDAARLEAELGERIVELEERLDFVERRLVQERDPQRLPPPARTPV